MISSTHDELKMSALDYRIEVMNYIIKDEESYHNKIAECITEANNLYHRPLNNVISPKLEYKTGGAYNSILLKDIYTIESYDNHRLFVTGKNWSKYIPMSLKNVMAQLDSSFFKCHKSAIVNMDHISDFSKPDCTVKLDNDYDCIVAKRSFNRFRSEYNSYAISRKENSSDERS